MRRSAHDKPFICPIPEIHSAEQYKNNRAGQQLEMLAFDYLVPRKLICLNLDLDDA